jgi:hypothetical protein
VSGASGLRPHDHSSLGQGGTGVTPGSHATTHESAGSDAIRLDQLAVPTADVSLNSHKLTSVTDPGSPQDAATKAYVDSTVAGAGGLSDEGVVTYLDWTVATAPANPASGYLRVYAKTGGDMAQRDSSGTETLLDQAGGGSAVGAKYSASGSTSVANSTQTRVACDTSVFDTDAFKTADGQFTIPSGKDGKYIVTAWVAWDTHGMDSFVGLRVNGSTYHAVQGTGTTGGFFSWYQSVTDILNLAATDYVEIMVRQLSGSPINVTSSEFSLLYLGA